MEFYIEMFLLNVYLISPPALPKCVCSVAILQCSHGQPNEKAQT